MVGLSESEGGDVKESGITLRYFDGCPNWGIAKARLEEALESLGESRSIKLERVETAHEADELDFRGTRGGAGDQPPLLATGGPTWIGYP